MPTNIEWCTETWNPIVGCSMISPGCTNCYAMRMAARLAANPATPQYQGTVVTNGRQRWSGLVNSVPFAINQPLHWKKPRMIFVNSMSDLFHEDVPTIWLDTIFDVMEQATQHTFQVLTKRSERMRGYVRDRQLIRKTPSNIWLGVSVENETFATARIPNLQQSPAAVRFLSIEPLLGPIRYLDLDGIDWVIVGGESGPGARPMLREWATNVRDQCIRADVPFFFKQWGGARPKSGGHELDGREWREFPRAHRP